MLCKLLRKMLRCVTRFNFRTYTLTLTVIMKIYSSPGFKYALRCNSPGRTREYKSERKYNERVSIVV